MCLLIGHWDVSPDWTTTAASSVPAGTLQALGSWSSEAFTRCVRPGVDGVLSALQAMSSSMYYMLLSNAHGFETSVVRAVCIVLGFHSGIC